MEHLERMQRLRNQVDIIIAQTKQLCALPAGHLNVTLQFQTYSTGVGGNGCAEHQLTVLSAELRALIERRINEAELEIRKLGMVAPRPGPESIAAERERQMRAAIDAQPVAMQNSVSRVDATQERTA